MNAQIQKQLGRGRRHRRVRRRLWGTAARPRVAIFRSNMHISAQAIDDDRGATVVSAASVDADIKALLGDKPNGGNVKAAIAVGSVLAKRCADRGIISVCFDRGGYRYHGRVKALADAARKGGLKF